MIPRLLHLPSDKSLFLFGARNTGKSTLIAHYYGGEHCQWFDLLDPELEQRFTNDPNEFYNIVQSLPEEKSHIVIDEIQKVPKLLDIIHRLMKNKNCHFIMTGSSARKLKAGAANLLAGRAFVYNLFPMSYLELGETFHLQNAMEVGLLPEVVAYHDKEEQHLFLQAYGHTYLKEEIISEQFIRKLDPFRRFLEVLCHRRHGQLR